MSDFLYKNAPLVEVIAEVHWELKALNSHPEARIDPYFDLFREQFTDSLKRDGFNLVEQLFPAQIPAELLPHRPHFRFRKSENQWPLFQLGPGLLSANIIPPYNGWNEFRKHLSAGVEALVSNYPLAHKTLNINKLELRYIDAFTDEFGMDDYAAFLERDLSIPSLLPGRLVSEFVPKNNSPEPRIEISFLLVKPEKSTGSISVGLGSANNQKAAVVEMVCRQAGQSHQLSPDKLGEWFDTAHEAVSNWFDMIVSDALKEKMGPKIPLGEGK